MKISIIIPAYNAQDYCHKCLSSIINQTYKDYEVIIINDGSTDSTKDILETYKKYPNFKVINQSNRGQAYSRNIGIKETTGDYLTFIDIDDFIDTSFLEKMYSCAKKNNSDIVYCDYYDYYNDTKKYIIKNDSHPMLTNYAPWGKLYKTSFFKNTKLKFLEGKLFEDIVITPVLAGLTNPIHVDEPLYYYNRGNVSSIRRKEYNSKLEDIYDALDSMIDNFKKYNIYEKYKEEIEFICLDSFLKGSVMRFADFKEGKKQIPIIRKKVLKYFPNILDNKYYKQATLKDKTLYNIDIYMNPTLLVFFKRIGKAMK